MKYSRYHALGNDYLVVSASDLPFELSATIVERICHRHFGIGSDGILVHEPSSSTGSFVLRIFNPDGSEAEKSGNGLRIFARYLWDNRLVSEKPFSVDTRGGRVECQITEQGHSVTVEMGCVSFKSSTIPVTGLERDVINELIQVGDKELTFCAATIGNPHCVVLNLDATRETAEQYGPILERHPLFPNRTNVQFLKVLSRSRIRIEIWERGAGYTLASGSSSSAAAAVAYKLGLVDSDITVEMPGGSLSISIREDLSVRMSGPVTRISNGDLFSEALQDLL